MIQLYSGTVLVLGITKRNVDLLLDDRPIKVELQRPIDKMIIIFGKDKPSIIRKVESSTGMEVPEAVKKEAERDPL